MLQILAILLGASLVIACPFTDKNKECDGNCCGDKQQNVDIENDEAV